MLPAMPALLKRLVVREVPQPTPVLVIKTERFLRIVLPTEVFRYGLRDFIEVNEFIVRITDSSLVACQRLTEHFAVLALHDSIVM